MNGATRAFCRRQDSMSVAALTLVLGVSSHAPCDARVAFASRGGLTGQLQWPGTVSEAPTVGPVSIGNDGGLIVVVRGQSARHIGPGEAPRGPCTIWASAVNARDEHGAHPQRVWSEIRCDVPFTEVVSMASSPEALWLGTDRGILQVQGGRVETLRPRALKMAITPPVYSDFTGEGVKGLCLDAAGRAWVVPPWISPVVCVFRSGGTEEERVVHRLFGLYVHGLWGSSGAEGAWILASKGKGKESVVHLTPDLLPSTEANLGVPWPWQNSVRIGRLLDEAPAFKLSRVCAEAWRDTLWVSGDLENRVRILVYRDKQPPEEQRGFEQLLGNSRVTDIAFDKVGTVYFATDGAGVIVFDGQQWQPHPMNKDLPVVTGTNRKPVNYVLPLSDGRVAVCTGEYLLIWSGEERKEHR